uniref:Capsid protein n=1 Tax=Emberiza spodocephala Genomoviridae sp. TaxID=2814950 RepID=A0A8E7L493_9VIRU|nr:MAG: capsid protein [Gemycircularvirus]UBQ66247.1 Cap protein [finch CRESS-DNA virus]
MYRRVSRRKYRPRTYRKKARVGTRRSASTYRRTKRTSRPMSKKRLLNVTSRKKRDTMLSWSNTSTAGASITTNVGAMYVPGNLYGYSLWSPTARDLSQFSGPAGAVGQEAMRTATTCYMRGLSENIRVQTSSGLPWLWRRICFKFKGPQFYTIAAGDTPTQPWQPWLESSNGYARQWFNATVNNQGNTTSIMNSYLFKGVQGQDWNDVLIAPVDSRRVDVAYDKYRRISSGNASGQLKEYKLWHPMNKNLVYNDDESGESEITAFNSVQDKRGMGDYYILDLLVPGVGATSSDILAISSTASLYWHER